MCLRPELFSQRETAPCGEQLTLQTGNEEQIMDWYETGK